MNYEVNALGMDLLFAICSTDEPYLYKKPEEITEVNSDFVNKMKSQEKEVVEFLSKYYDQAPQQKYSNLEKICKIKEIPSDPENTETSMKFEDQ